MSAASVTLEVRGRNEKCRAASQAAGFTRIHADKEVS